ncbi:MAG: hypothetical protein HZB16_13590 [Armatimonadetes bacterium]|nr:hypothetical protein [Armatimonadota bacterium]
MRIISLATLLGALPVMAVPPSISPSTYGGWKATSLSNGLVEVVIVPQIGGRIIQYKLGDKEFFWVNPDLKGKTSPPSGLGPDGAWLNYGGEKLWPAPQGAMPDGWPGPPDAILDGSPHTLTTYSADGHAAVRLTSLDDPRSGIRFSRSVRVFPGTTRVSIEATMINIDSKPRRWGIWSVTQNNGVAPTGRGYNNLLSAYCPTNPRSRYAGGYNVMCGSATNPTFRADPVTGVTRVDYQYQVGKIGLDSVGGWVGVVDGASGYCFVERYTPHPDKPYPDNASVEFWSSGLGKVHETDPAPMPNDPKLTPYLVESELLGPLTSLAPGESTTFCYSFQACNVGGTYPILDCTEVGVTCERLRVGGGSSLHVTGRFGVFQPGRLALRLLDAKARVRETIDLTQVATPLKPVPVDVTFDRRDLPVAALALVLLDESGKQVGVLGRVDVGAGR